LCATPFGAEQTALFLQNVQLFSVFVFANKREGEIVAQKARGRTVYVETDGERGGAVWLSWHKKNAQPFRFKAARVARAVVDPTGAGDVFAGTFLALWFLSAQKDGFIETLDEKQIKLRLKEICRTAAKLAARVTAVPLCKVKHIFFNRENSSSRK
jgi:sugar/nucleoside kinase (ribokinase family)